MRRQLLGQFRFILLIFCIFFFDFENLEFIFRDLKRILHILIHISLISNKTNTWISRRETEKRQKRDRKKREEGFEKREEGFEKRDEYLGRLEKERRVFGKT